MPGNGPNIVEGIARKQPRADVAQKTLVRFLRKYIRGKLSGWTNEGDEDA